MIGILSPDGIFTECESNEHLDIAVEVCEREYGKVFPRRVDAEDHLLSLGYFIIRARDAYRSYRDSNMEFRFLTDKQVDWISENTKNLNDMQRKDIDQILSDNKRSNDIFIKALKEG